MVPSRLSVSDDAERLSGSGFSKTLVAVRSEKRVLRIGFEYGNSLNFRGACHSCSPAQNRSISRDEYPETSIRVSRASGRPMSKSNFPVFRSAATQTPCSCRVEQTGGAPKADTASSLGTIPHMIKREAATIFTPSSVAKVGSMAWAALARFVRSGVPVAGIPNTGVFHTWRW